MEPIKHTLIELHRTTMALGSRRSSSSVDDPGDFLEYADPIILSQNVRGSINWAWLAWHVSHDRKDITSTLEKTVELAQKAKEGRRLKKAAINDRGEFDHFILTAALLSGNPALAGEAAATVSGADPRSKQYQYDAALAGVIAASVLGNDAKRGAQLSIMKKFKPTRVNAFPSPGLVKAFVSGTDAELHRAIAAGVERYWTDWSIYRGPRRFGTLPGQLVYEDETRIGLDLGRRSPHWMWPYMEATFAKLAALQGRKIRYDDFWFPLALITGQEDAVPPPYVVRIMPEEKRPTKRPLTRRQTRAAKSLAGVLGLMGVTARAGKAPKRLKR